MVGQRVTGEIPSGWGDLWSDRGSPERHRVGGETCGRLEGHRRATEWVGTPVVDQRVTGETTSPSRVWSLVYSHLFVRGSG